MKNIIFILIFIFMITNEVEHLILLAPALPLPHPWCNHKMHSCKYTHVHTHTLFTHSFYSCDSVNITISCKVFSPHSFHIRFSYTPMYFLQHFLFLLSEHWTIPYVRWTFSGLNSQTGAHEISNYLSHLLVYLQSRMGWTLNALKINLCWF